MRVTHFLIPAAAIALAACQPKTDSKATEAAPRLHPPYTASIKLIQFDKTGAKPQNSWIIQEALRADGSTYRADKLESDPHAAQATLYFVKDQRLVTLDPVTKLRFEKPSRSAFRQPKPLRDDCLQELGGGPQASCEATSEKRLGYAVHRYRNATEENGRKFETTALVAKELGWLMLEQESKIDGVLSRRREVTAVTPGEPAAALFEVSAYEAKDEVAFVEAGRKARGLTPAGK